MCYISLVPGVLYLTSTWCVISQTIHPHAVAIFNTFRFNFCLQTFQWSLFHFRLQYALEIMYFHVKENMLRWICGVNYRLNSSNHKIFFLSPNCSVAMLWGDCQIESALSPQPSFMDFTLPQCNKFADSLYWRNWLKLCRYPILLPSKNFTAL